MKFLPKTLDNSNLMFIRTFYTPGSKETTAPDDRLDVVFKDLNTGDKYVETIESPKTEIHIVDPKHRTYTYHKNFIDRSWCNSYEVPYKKRQEVVARALGCTVWDARRSPYVSQIDLDIEHFYMMQFQKFYQTKSDQTPLKLAFSDIESDIIAIGEGFASPGEAPMNAVSYFDETNKIMYTLVCTQDNVPHVPKASKKYEYYEKLRERFKKKTDDFVNRLDEFVEECKKEFEPSYGKIEYKVMVFEDEMAMHKAYWQIVDMVDADYAFFWNAPYDISNLIERVKLHGYNPNDIISSPEMQGNGRVVTWKEDKNAEVHKRRHVFNTFTRTTFMDQMVNYAGIRSGKGKLPSVKLNAIAMKELKDEKLDYSEYGNIKMFPYYDWWKFVKYNIKDVLLQVGIERKVHDASYCYMVMTNSALKPSEIFASTQLVSNDLRMFADIEYDKVMGINNNKFIKNKMSDEDRKLIEKFAGAFVMNPSHCRPTGFKLLGMLNKFIHENSIDFDVSGEFD